MIIQSVSFCTEVSVASSIFILSQSKDSSNLSNNQQGHVGNKNAPVASNGAKQNWIPASKAAQE